MPVRGGEPIQVTKNGGLAALESADGKFVYYQRAGSRTRFPLKSCGI